MAEIHNITLDGTSIESLLGIAISRSDFFSFPSFSRSEQALPYGNRTVLTHRGLISNQATVNIYIDPEMYEAEAQFKVEDLMRNLKKILQRPQFVLGYTTKIGYTEEDAGVETELVYQDVYMSNYAHEPSGYTLMITLSLVMNDPVAYGLVEQTLLTNQNVTTATANLTTSEAVEGNYDRQQPLIVVDINAITSGAGDRTLSIFMNDDYTNGMTLSNANGIDWDNADQIVIDCAAQTVTVDGVKVFYSGVLPRLAPEVINTLYYQDTFTSRDLDVSITNVPRYI